MADPYRCLRTTSIAIGIYNIIYCLIQYGVLGWQVKTVKAIQWEYENRQLPATGSIDGFQARFPGLYAIYTETPERRRINLLFVIVLICLGLSMIHLMTTISMLYGTIRRSPSWIVPWFFTCGPIVVMCTAYAVLWWSGDVFNEQLTMSVAEFVMSLAINGVAFIVVLLYYLRITGHLKSERPAWPAHAAAFSNQSFDYNTGSGNKEWDSQTTKPQPVQYPLHYQQRQQQRSINRQQQQLRQQQSQMYRNRPESAQYFGTGSSQRKSRSHSPCGKPVSKLPAWHETMPDKPPCTIGRKMRRRERDQARSPIASLRMGHNYRVTHSFDATASLRRQASLESRAQSALATNAQFASFDASYASPVPVQYAHITPTTVPPRHFARNASSTAGGAHRYTQQHARSQPAQQNEWRKPPSSSVTGTTCSAPTVARRKSPQRVSFKSRPKVYERTPDSSQQSDSGGSRNLRPILREIQTVV